jgi:hypothetical protein
MNPKPITLQPGKPLARPEELTAAQVREVIAEGDAALLDMEAEQEAKQKADLLRRIRTLRQKLAREAKGAKCTDNRRKEIEGELEDLHPSYTRPSARELGFATDPPSVDEILEAATILRGLRSKELHLVFAKLAEKNPETWGEVAKREAVRNPKIERTRERIKFGDIKEAAESKWSNVDRVIAEHYFKSERLRKPLRELSAEKAVIELLFKLGVDITPKPFERVLRRLCLV